MKAVHKQHGVRAHAWGGSGFANWCLGRAPRLYHPPRPAARSETVDEALAPGFTRHLIKFITCNVLVNPENEAMASRKIPRNS